MPSTSDSPIETTSHKSSPSDYRGLLSHLKSRIQTARVKAQLAVNRELVTLYWDIGQIIVKRQETEGWGKSVIDRLSRDLKDEFPEMTGFSPRNLKYMRKFAIAWPDQAIVQQTIAQIPWGSNLTLLEKLDTPKKRLFYALKTIENGWSRNVLAHQIESQLHLRAANQSNNFSLTLPKPQSDLARELVKDRYNLEFLDVQDQLHERKLEQQLIEQLRHLLLELGVGFAFIGNQYRIEVADTDYFLDLLFYHTRLHCYVVVELKIDSFKPEYAGKMQFYLSAVDDLLSSEQDAPSIGILLCKERNKVVVEYALRDSAKPIAVADYTLKQTLPDNLKDALPDARALEQMLQTDEELPAST